MKNRKGQGSPEVGEQSRPRGGGAITDGAWGDTTTIGEMYGPAMKMDRADG